MQLTGPLFLFLFLPLSLLFTPFCPVKYRQGVFSLLSVLWYVLANLGEPLAMLQLFVVMLAVVVLSVLPDGDYSTLRCAAGVLIPLASLLAARLAAEYGPAEYVYPTGLTFVALGAISLAVDRYRGDAPDRDSPLAVLGYLLFFPTLTLGPILRYKQYLYMMEHPHVGLDGFSRGVRLYMLGFIKRIAVAAVLLRALQTVLGAQAEEFSVQALIFCMVLAYFLFYFFVSGTTDMARGLLSMYGMQPPRGQGALLAQIAPHRLLEAMLISLSRYLEDYVAKPILHRFPARWGRALAGVAVCALTLLFYRTRPELLLLGIPLLLIAALSANKHRSLRNKLPLYWRFPLQLLSCFLLAMLVLAALLEEPAELFTHVINAFRGDTSFYHIYSSLADGAYIAMFFAGALLVFPLQYFRPVLSRKVSARARGIALSLSTAVLFLGFVITLIHFMPQFPQYAQQATFSLFM